MPLLCLGCNYYSDTVSSYATDVLTQADNGRTITVNSGQHIRVELKAQAGYRNWTVPATSDENILTPVMNDSQPAKDVTVH